MAELKLISPLLSNMEVVECLSVRGAAGVYFYRNRRRLPDDRAGGLTKTQKQEEKKRCELEWDMMCIDCRRAAN